MYFGLGVWKGIVSSSWMNSSNWGRQVIPDLNTYVSIPPGCLYYPLLSGTLAVDTSAGVYLCKGIEIFDGAMMRNSDSIHVNGEFRIAGQYIADNNTNHSQHVFAKGFMDVLPSGIVRLGNQTSGIGTCDLIIHSGGKLNISGGILDIDDQLNVLDNGSFNMTGGQVFAHKHGAGSALSSSSPGAFYIGEKTSGVISGGKIKVCGKTTVADHTAVNILSDQFSMNNQAILEITHGDELQHQDVEIKTPFQSPLNHVFINKPGNTTSFVSNALLQGDMKIFPGSELTINQGVILTVNGSFLLLK